MDNNEFTKKNDKKYACELCDFYTNKKTDYNIHLDTKKHKNRELIPNNNDFTKKNDTFDCECGKSYKHKPNLYAHKKKCKLENEDKLIVYDENNLNYKDMFLQLLQKTDALHNLIIEQNKIIQDKDKTINEIIPKIGNNNINNANVNSNNKNFNICLFLNENCKDALSMDEFVKKIEIKLTDLLLTKQKGIVNGISNIFIRHLNELPEKKRPLWCSDKKRKKYLLKMKNGMKMLIILKLNRRLRMLVRFKLKILINIPKNIQTGKKRKIKKKNILIL